MTTVIPTITLTNALSPMLAEARGVGVAVGKTAVTFDICDVAVIADRVAVSRVTGCVGTGCLAVAICV